ncbi:hypothetical protein DEO72_LG7g1888 [Vigna unguiculata]|uniref:Uncharacterized protein n=1 Tax=Vigna unguiculata TaxID=3917 RepID=A0A4D6MHV1_VIGUN|nr:hypothetical protein DEO72_LG7g1888 [Vigna unguiculata]
MLLPDFGEQVRGWLLPGFGEQARVVVCVSQGRQRSYRVLVRVVRGITCLSRCVSAQGERFFPRSVGAQGKELVIWKY